MSFSTFLIGTLLVSSLVLLVLLVAPKPRDDLRSRGLPLTGMALAGLLVVLAFIGGLTLGG